MRPLRPCNTERVPDSELFVTPDGAIYHLGLRPEQLAQTVLLVGDPGRVDRVSERFDSVEHRIENREFRTHTGRLGTRRLSVMSTGIGTDNIDIVLTEIDALANVDLSTRLPRDQPVSLDLLRLGTSGGLQPDVAPGSIAVSRYALGLDGVLPFYACEPEPDEAALVEAARTRLRWPAEWNPPYVAGADPDLFDSLAADLVQGITITANGFFGPQCRTVRLPLRHPDFNDRLREFRHDDLRCVNYEMETSALFGLGRALGHRACTMCVVVANRYDSTVSDDPHADVENLIDIALERLIAS